jgi:hypothetical protein
MMCIEAMAAAMIAAGRHLDVRTKRDELIDVAKSAHEEVVDMLP